MSYRSSLNFVPIEWFCAKLIIIHPHAKHQVNISKRSEKRWSQLFYFGITDMGNTICPGHLVTGHTNEFHYALRYWLDFWYLELTMMSYRSSFIGIGLLLRRFANVSPFFYFLSNRLRITNYCLRSVSASLLKFTRFIQGNNIASTNLDTIRNLQHLHMKSLRFVPVQWSLAELWALDFEIWPNI
jgi:hypothetical protein